jgi:thermostable 8-oxoguanine DNA glycosylase
MTISWQISDSDIQKIKKVVKENNNQFVKIRIARNIEKKDIAITKNNIIHSMVMCLLTSQQRSGPNSLVSKFLSLKPFPLTEALIEKTESKERYIKAVFLKNGLTRFINKNSSYFSANIDELRKGNWSIIKKLEYLITNPSKENERKLADYLKLHLKGFGPKQSRNFLQSLGVTKYEIPIDSRIIKWLNKFGFPINLSSTLLSDNDYYHFVSDGIQELCEKAEIYPCVLDAVIFSSYDGDEWTAENMML